GVLPLPAVYLTVTVASVLGSALDFLVGRRLGKLELWRVRYQDQLQRFERAYRRRGDWVILVNRFLPGIRGFLFLAAGMAGMGFGRTMILGAVSAAAWNGVLLAAGLAVGAHLGRMQALVRTYSAVVWVSLLLLGAVLLVRLVLHGR